MVFASPSGQFYHDMTNSAHLSGTTPSGQLHHDTKRSSIYQDFAKTHANPDTDGNSLNRRAVRLSKNLLFLFITMGLGILQKTPDFVS